MTRSHARLWNIRLTPAKFMLATSLSILFLGFFKDAASGQPESPKSETADAMIRMDGFFDDWRGEAVILDDTGDAPDAELDIGTLQMRSDTSFIHFLVGLNRELNLQRLEVRWSVCWTAMVI